MKLSFCRLWLGFVVKILIFQSWTERVLAYKLNWIYLIISEFIIVLVYVLQTKNNFIWDVNIVDGKNSKFSFDIIWVNFWIFYCGSEDYILRAKQFCFVLFFLDINMYLVQVSSKTMKFMIIFVELVFIFRVGGEGE